MPQYKLISVEKMKKRFSRRIYKRKFANNHYAMFRQVKTQEFPSKFNLCNYTPLIFDQAQVSSCTANAVCMMYMILRRICKYDDVVFSRRWLYFMERFREALVNNGGVLPKNWYDLVQTNGGMVVGDEGAFAEDGVQTLVECGCPKEDDYPYVEFGHDPAVNAIPPESLKEKAKEYIPKGGADVYVDTIDGRLDGQLFDPVSLENSIKTQLYLNKRPVLVGFQCMAPQGSDKPVTLDHNGVMHLPPEDWRSIGGHEVLIVGWDDDLKALLIQNSWGPGFGVQPPGANSAGYFYMSYDFAFHTKDENDGTKFYDLTAEYRTMSLDMCEAPPPTPVDPDPEPLPLPVPPSPPPSPPRPVPSNLQEVISALNKIATTLQNIDRKLQPAVPPLPIPPPQPPQPYPPQPPQPYPPQPYPPQPYPPQPPQPYSPFPDVSWNDWSHLWKTQDRTGFTPRLY